MATAEFSKYADILSTALSQHHLLGFETAHIQKSHISYAKVESALKIIEDSDPFENVLPFCFKML